jgi:hypothetical protein
MQQIHKKQIRSQKAGDIYFWILNFDFHGHHLIVHARFWAPVMIVKYDMYIL